MAMYEAECEEVGPEARLPFLDAYMTEWQKTEYAATVMSKPPLCLAPRD